MKMLSKLLVASFVCCVLSVGVFAQAELEALDADRKECLKKSDWNCVIEASTKLIKVKPGQYAYYLGRGFAYFQTNKFEEALKDLQKASLLSPSDHLPLVSIAQIYGFNGDRATALSHYKKALALSGDADIQFLIDILNDKTKTDQDLREAFGSNICRNAYKLEKDFAKEGKSTVALVLVAGKDFEKLKLVLPCKLDLNKQVDDMTPLVSALLADLPEYVTELLKYGANPNMPIRLFNGGTPLIYSVDPGGDIKIAKILLANGASPFLQDTEKEDALDHAKWDSANATLIMNAVDARKPFSLLEVQERASFYFRHQEFAKAIPDLSAALKLSPGNPQIVFARGVCYRFAKKFDLAITDFTELIKTSPNSANLFYVRGVSYLESGNKTAAETDFAKAIELDPKFAGEIEKDRVRVAGNK